MVFVQYGGMSDVSANVKVVLFSIIQKKLSVYFPHNVLPHARKTYKKSLNSLAQSVIKNCLQITPSDFYLEQLYSFSNDLNDEIDIVYYVLIPSYTIRNSNSEWFEVEKINTNEADWEKIHYALQRLRWKVEYTNVVYSLLPQEFTLSELQSIYEAILGKKLDKRNFRKKILLLKILQLSKHIKKGGKARPAQMYQFKEKKMVMVNVF